MANQVDYRDPTPNNFPQDYDPAKVEPRVKLRSDSIKHKQKGIDTREAMYQALEIGSVTANEAKSKADKTAESQDSLNQRVNDQIAANTIKDEEIDFRHSDMLKKTFDTMRLRGNFFDYDLVDRGFNVKWLINDDSPMLNDAITMIQEGGLSNNIVVPEGEYVINDSIKLIKSDVRLTFMKGAEVKVTVPEKLPEDKQLAILDIGTNVEINRLAVSGLKIKVPKIENIKTIGIRINSMRKLETPVVDVSFEDVKISDADIGLATTFCWGIDFRNVRLQSCSKPIELGPQSNNFEFTRCSFVTFNQMMSVWNSEDINFRSCEFANAGESLKSAIGIYQSGVTFDGSYIENIRTTENPDVNFMVIGSYNDVNSSVIRIVGGKSTDSIVNIMNSSKMPVHLELFPPQGGNFNLCNFKSDETEKGVFSGISVPSNLATISEYEKIKFFDGKQKVEFDDSWGGGGVVKDFDPSRGELTVRNVADGFNGIKIGGLTKGASYTLIYASRTDVPFKNGNLLATTLKATDGNLFYSIFEANTDVLHFDLSPNSNFTVSKLAVVKGVKFPLI